MKKLLIGAVLVTTLAGVLVTAGTVYAQTPEPPTQPQNGWGMGRMMRNQFRGMMDGGIGVLHDYLISAFAEKLGMSVEDLNAALAEGKTIRQIASEKGLSSDEIVTMRLEARKTAVEKAVADGVLTQKQVDWMKKRIQQRRADGGWGRGCWGAPQN